jgi:N-acyl homoserine lactone hydrolase
VRLDDVRPLHLADVVAFGATAPVNAWEIDHPDGTIVVDTGIEQHHPGIDAEWKPTIHPWPQLGEVVAVVNTHLHFDHCGGNRRFAGTPTYVQRAELEAVAAPAYIVEWARFPGESYVLLEGDADVAPGVSVLSTPGHSAGHQSVVVDTEDGLVVLAGDVTYSMRELIAGGSPGIDRIHALEPRRVYLAHADRPWDRW